MPSEDTRTGLVGDERFVASRLKVARAEEHWEEFVALSSVYIARNPIKLMVEIPPAGFPEKHHAWVIRIKEPLPPKLSAIAGDAVHNLRTALDLLACDLVRSAGGSTKGVYFPFAERETDLPEMIRKRNFQRAGAAAVRLVKELKPFPGGNVSLRGLHDLDILDKHKSLVPVLGAATSPTATIRFYGGEPTNLPVLRSAITHDGQIVWLMPAVSNIPLGSELPFGLEINFGDDAGVFSGREILATLRDLTSEVTRIVELFAAQIEAAPVPGE